MQTSQIERIAELNDLFRQEDEPELSQRSLWVETLPETEQQALLNQVRRFTAFGPEHDPYGERSAGAFAWSGDSQIIWRIDYHDQSLEYGSDDPADPTVTTRLLTLTLADAH